MLAHQIEALMNRREHAEAQTIDLQNADLVQVVLVPLDYGAVVHRGIFDRHHLAQRPLGHHHAAHVLRQMPRKAHDLVHTVNEPPSQIGCRINAHFAAAPTSFGSCV